MSFRQLTVLLLVLLVSITLVTDVAHACPTCGKAEPVLPPGSEAVAKAGGGFNASIYVLLGTVVAAMSFLAWTFAKTGKTRVPGGPAVAE